MKQHLIAGQQLQKGMVLLVGLMLLAPMSLLGLASTADSTVQIKLAGNLGNATRAEYRALSQLKSAEQWLLGLQSAGKPPICTQACSGTQTIAVPGAFSTGAESESEAWWQNQGHWLIEELETTEVELEDHSTLEIGFYRVLTRSEASPDAAPVIMQSVVAVPWTSPDDDEQFDCPVEPAISACGRVSWKAIQ